MRREYQYLVVLYSRMSPVLNVVVHAILNANANAMPIVNAMCIYAYI